MARAVEIARELIAEADGTLRRGDSLDAASWHYLAQQQAIRISDFLSIHGEEVDAADPSLVDKLGQAVDVLSKAAEDTLSSAQKSAFLEGLKSYPQAVLDEAKAKAKAIGGAAGEGATEALKAFLKTPGGKIVLIVVVLMIVAYFWRAVK